MPTKKHLKPGNPVKRIELAGHSVVFRYPRWKDVPDYTRVMNSLVRERSFNGILKRTTMKKEKKWFSDIFKKMKKGDMVMLIAEVDGGFAGDALVERKPLEANKHVCTIGIQLHKDFRGKGIGTELMKAIIQQAKDTLGSRVLELRVIEPNESAMRAYERLGFKATGKVPKGFNYYGRYCDEIIMVREI